jgi:hypothetical protein
LKLILVIKLSPASIPEMMNILREDKVKMHLNQYEIAADSPDSVKIETEQIKKSKRKYKCKKKKQKNQHCYYYYHLLIIIAVV